MTRVAIVGAGIGGLTTAIALRSFGFEAAIYEAAPALAPVGAGIWVPPNAMQVLAALGAREAVAAAGVRIDRVQIRTIEGTVLQELDAAAARERYGEPIISILRTRLVEALASRLPGHLVQPGKRCLGATHDQEGVALRFDDGSEARADLVVAADGIHSALRNSLFGPTSLRYAGQTCYRGIARMASGELGHTCAETWGTRCRIGYSAVGPDEVYWFAPVSSPAGTRLDPVRVKAQLLDMYAAFPHPVRLMLSETPTDRIIQTDLHDFAPLPRWSTGHIVLLGDAAHAMTPNLGQGGAQAIEDAWVLASELARQDWRGALEAYEAARKPRTSWVAAAARRIGQIAHLENPLAQGLRNALMTRTPASIQRRHVQRLFSAEHLDLPTTAPAT
jgi:2-polyprenyl-6-methoxyphenol hydroxylase-like FAD-dependent oxidoreductase